MLTLTSRLVTSLLVLCARVCIQETTYLHQHARRVRTSILSCTVFSRVQYSLSACSRSELTIQYPTGSVLVKNLLFYNLF